MPLNVTSTRELLQEFDFQTLFREELSWSNPKTKAIVPFQTKEGLFYHKAIADLSGASVFEITSEEGTIPDARIRGLISAEIQKLNFEHILIFVDKDRSQSIWRWIKKQDKKSLPREHPFFRGQTGDAFIGKLSGLMVDISEIENDITITDVAKKIQKALDVEKVTKRFFQNYQQQFIDFLPLIEGIDNEADKRWYASVILNRLMFIYFLQQKGFLDNNNLDYLWKKAEETKKQFGKNKYYSKFLNLLFFEGFAKPEESRGENEKNRKEINDLLGTIPYLNGGLFLKHKIEEKYPNIAIPDVAFENLLKSDEPKGLFEQFSWSLDDTPGGKDDEINPGVLGYIFEKYINQKAFGAYYTRPEITEYLCEQTVYKLILDEINGPVINPEHLKLVDLDKGPQLKRYQSIEELLLHLDAGTCRKLIDGDNAVLTNLSLLDPACGSGAFLVAAMKTLINVYAAVIGRIEFLGDRKLTDWKKDIEKEHYNIQYFIKKKIITNNLYGVDIMEEATEIAKLRLFLALVSSAQSVEQLEPLPNIDFNIMNGNSLIGLMRVDANRFNNFFQKTAVKAPKQTVVQKASLFNNAIGQINLFGENHAKGYQELINEKEAAINSYRHATKLGKDALEDLRDSIQKKEEKATETLNQLLIEEFNNLGIRYNKLGWDNVKGKEIIEEKKAIGVNEIKMLEPFHWGYKFSEIFRKKNGFDAIITNPPWEIFKPDAKEFFADYSDVVTKKKMNIKDFETEQKLLLEDSELKAAWLEYLSRFPHVSLYYRSANQYKNQISVINGKKAGTDINYYKLFTEQCFNLLKKNGYCGIVIPSGIYTDLGTKQLRQMLFNETKLTGLFCFENRKEVFENVHRSFKFLVLSFEKGQVTQSFPAAFMRHELKELEQFPKYGAFEISVDFVKKQSPDSLSVMEIKNEVEFKIVSKMLHFPLLGEIKKDSWHLKLGAEFHMTNDNRLFKSNLSYKDIPLYEGKMIWQFQIAYATPKYWINEKEGRKAILGNQVDNGQELDYQNYRLGFRDIAASTNERSVIAAITPKVFHGNKIPQSIIFENDKRIISNTDLVYLVAFFNSYPFDFHIRNRITTTLNFHFVYNTPCPRLNSTHKWYKSIVERSAKLICTTEEFAELWEEVNKTKWNEKAGATHDAERNKLRAELDGIIAHIYGLTEEEFTYILSTFPIVPVVQKQAALQYFIELAPQFSTDISAIDWPGIISKGESIKLEFKSTLRIDIRAGNVVDKKIEHSVLKTLAAFLNSDGGTLLIGVEDNKNIIGLDLDFNSFFKPDKLDEFQKHFDNLIHKSIGNRFQRYLDISFPEIDSKMICAITIKEKSSEPVYLIEDAGNEKFYIRRQASTIDLKPSEANKYIKDHWK